MLQNVYLIKLNINETKLTKRFNIFNQQWNGQSIMTKIKKKKNTNNLKTIIQTSMNKNHLIKYKYNQIHVILFLSIN